MGILLVLQLINGLLGLVSFVLAIMVLIKLYNAEGAGQMLLGLFCGLYLFIWGWQNADRLGFAKEMRAWKLCLLAQLVVVALFLVVGMAGA
ncbi:MAG TPA: hypothetical protein VI197_22025 [Polyangiaceae bacterium]